MTVAWVDGALRDAARASVSIHDRAFTLGDGLFETMRAYGGQVFRLRAHIRRLARGARRLEIPPPRGLAHAVRATLDANELEDAAVRITLSRGRAGPGIDPPDAPLPTVVVTARPFRLDERAQQRGVRAAIAAGRLNELGAAAGLKSIGRLEHVLARAEARRAGADAAILLDTAGHLAEADVANLFLVRGGELHTPPQRCGIVPGITRDAVIEIARARDIATRDRTLEPDELWDADEAFLTNSLREILPLVAVDDRPVGSGRPGALTMRLIDAYRDLTSGPNG